MAVMRLGTWLYKKIAQGTVLAVYLAILGLAELGDRGERWAERLEQWWLKK